MEPNKNQSWFNILTDIDTACYPLEEVSNVLYLFDELIREDVKNMDPEQPYTVTLFKNRFQLIMSLIWMAEKEIREIINELNTEISKGYDHRKAEMGRGEIGI